jgi:hypothetical protein
MACIQQPVCSASAAKPCSDRVGGTEIFLTADTSHIMEAFYQIWGKG